MEAILCACVRSSSVVVEARREVYNQVPEVLLISHTNEPASTI